MCRRLTILVFAVMFTPYAFAAKVMKVKGHNVLINLEGDAASPGEMYFATQNGHKKAILKILKVKGDKAIGRILKGRAAPGMGMIARHTGGGSGSSASRSENTASTYMPSSGRSYWGAMLGFSMDSMSVIVNNTSSVNLSGTGFSGKGMFDYELFPQVWFRGMAGIEQFAASGPSQCLGQTCDAKIMYFDIDFIGRYVFSEGKIRPWVGGGLGLLFPATKSSTALDSGSIGSTNVVLPMVGLDYFLNPTMYIPVSFEYALLPNSNEVKAHWMELRVGLAIPF